MDDANSASAFFLGLFLNLGLHVGRASNASRGDFLQIQTGVEAKKELRGILRSTGYQD